MPESTPAMARLTALLKGSICLGTTSPVSKGGNWGDTVIGYPGRIIRRQQFHPRCAGNSSLEDYLALIPQSERRRPNRFGYPDPMESRQGKAHPVFQPLSAHHHVRMDGALYCTRHR